MSSNIRPISGYWRASAFDWPAPAILTPMPRSLELFAGGGGMALGLRAAGFEHHALVEWEAKACATLLLNASKPDSPWPFEAVRELDARDYATGMRKADLGGSVDLVAGGPPCQPFSLGGVHAGDSDARNMFPVALDIVRQVQPRVVIFENVPGLLRPSFKPYFDYVSDQLAEPTVAPRAGEPWHEHWRRVKSAANSTASVRYRTARQVLLAADLGVPQMRKRVFLIGLREDLGVGWQDIVADHSADALLFDKYVSGAYWAEHETDPEVKRSLRTGIPACPSRQGAKVAALRHAGRPSAKRWRTVRDALRDPEQLPPPSEGRQRGPWPNHVGIAGARTYPGHTGSDIDAPSKTIKAGVHGVCGGEAMIRFRDGSLRYMTVRESARIQGFPDWYEFAGARSHAMRHIGNAVAVPVARAVGEQARTIVGL